MQPMLPRAGVPSDGLALELIERWRIRWRSTKVSPPSVNL